ncbi:hypothetical protein ACOSQ3_008717 [Xanthoceras sorbifolium]
MAVRYKFRSSVNFDSVDIDGRPSISIRDLKSKIVQSKKLNVCQDFDLVFADALTGQEYTDETLQISSGSSVIIKRVPAGLVPSDKTHNGSFADFGVKVNNEVKTSCPMNMEINFDDFGVDLCPVPEATLSCSDDIDVDKNVYTGNGRKNVDATRCLEPPAVGCKKFEARDLSKAIPRGPVHSGNKENNILETKSKPYVQQCIKTGNTINVNTPDMQNANFPSELKCSLCNKFFKEAVMIPCCQHSFCEKCIRSLLVEKARCPKCFSSKCRAEDLLPNLSLRQAIEHFLESQILFDGSDNDLHRYASDGESGIQAKGMACAVTIPQKDSASPDSPTATGRGSNQVVADEYDSLLRNNTSVGGTGSCVIRLGGDKSLKSCSLPLKVKQTDGERLGSANPVNFKSQAVDSEDYADFQGESQPIQEEAEYIIKKKRGLWVNTSGVDRNFMESGRHKKGDRTCYLCGSPDHFIRDCPAALNSNPMFHTGNAMFPGAMHGKVSPYWNGPPLPHMRPSANIYGNPGMMPFNAAMVPAAPYAVPTYVPSMFGSLPTYSGFMRMGGATAPVGYMERHPSCLRASDFQDREKKQKLDYENMRSEQFSDDVNKRRPSGEAKRLHDLKSRTNRERSESYSGDNGYTHRSHRKRYCDSKVDNDKHSFDDKHEKSSRSSIARELRPYHHSERLSSEVENMPSSSSWHADDIDRHKKHSRNSKKHNERMECHGDFSWSCYPTNKDKDVEMNRVKSDVKRHNQRHNSHSESGLEPSFSSDKKKRQEKKDLSHGSRHSRHNPKSVNDELNHDRWPMVRGSDKDSREDYRFYKRKRVY